MSAGAFDVLVLGAGYSGPLAAAVLSRMGYAVALVERGAPPRFAIGESTRSEQNRLHAYLGRRYGIPELVALSSYPRVRRARLPIAVWPKESFYFLMNPAAGGAPREIFHQTVPWPAGPDYHVLRSDLDLYLLAVARRCGARYFGPAAVTGLDFPAGGVRCGIETEEGERELRARLLLDATGHGSALAERFGLMDEDPPTLTLRSRAVYNHFLGARRLEETIGRAWPRRALDRDAGTGHHCSEHGWTWVIPFENGLTSVGAVLNMDRDPFAREGLSGPETFRRVVAENPALAAILADAEPARPWVSTGRMQRLARRTLGERWALLPPASGFTDPLLSPGMTVAAAAVARLAWGADRVLRRGEPAEEALGFLEERFLAETEHHARLQHALFESMRDFRLLRAANALDRLLTQLGGLALGADGAAGEGEPPFPAMWGAHLKPARELLGRVHRALVEGRDEPAESLAPRVEAALAEGDVFGFLGSALDRPRTPDVHLHPLRPLLGWTRALGRSPDPEAAALARGAGGRWTRGLPRLLLRSLREAFVPTTGRRPLAGLRLALRHVRIQLGM